eukprot:GILJ01010503.1.p1 GENE.GILJ01010503.1~~GILJ01010503.1.p1  ORF type:complete len:1514 (+),score=239.29 GILJ01010503.1:28-4569(+)
MSLTSLTPRTASMMPNAVNCVKGEIHNILAVMRFNPRFTSTARFHREIPAESENPLVRPFKALFETLISCQDLSSIDPLLYLQPFLDVVQAEVASGPITAVALSSIHKFLLYGFIHPSVLRVSEAINGVASAVANCKFEASSSSADEVVLMKMLNVILDSLRCTSGHYLNDENLWNLIQTCFRISRHHKTSELLHKTAENIFMQMILTIFTRLSTFEDTFHRSHTALIKQRSTSDSDSGTESVTDEVVTGYSVSCLYNVLKFLGTLTSTPVDSPNYEEARVLGLSVINVALETGGESIGKFPQLVSVIQDDICKSLLQNSRTDNLIILASTLRVVFNLFKTIKQHLKVQLEVFFNSIHLRIAESASSSFEQRELALESLLEFCREPSLMLELYMNYDCDVQCTNLFETLCRFLVKNSFPSNGKLNTLHLLSLEGILTIMESIAKRCIRRRRELSPNAAHANETTEGADPFSKDRNVSQRLRSRKEEKKRLTVGAQYFNSDPHKCIPNLQSINLLPLPADAKSMAHFLRNTPGLNKRLVGEYLGSPHKFNHSVLKEFSKLFDFANLALDEALRKFLCAFWLPGEAQQINRIMEVFAEAMIQQNPVSESNPVENSEAAYVLAYSIILLNTDLHKEGVKRKMSCEEFVRNNRGINNGKDFPIEYLTQIYESIRDNEIRMLTLHQDDIVAGDVHMHKWDGVLQRSKSIGTFTNTSTEEPAGLNERDMFNIIWESSTLATLSLIFEITQDLRIVQLTMDGFHSFARMAVYYDMGEVFNNLVVSLCKYFVKFFDKSGDDPILSLYSSHRSQIALEGMLLIVRQNIDWLRESWTNVLDCILLLHHMQLLPATLVELDDFSDSKGRRLSSTVTARPRGRSDDGGGLLSSLTSYIWGHEQSDEPTKQQEDIVNAEKHLKGLVAECHIEELFSDTRHLVIESLIEQIKALILASLPSGSSHTQGSYHHDQFSAVFCLELLTNMTIANEHRINLIWPLVAAHFERILTASSSLTLHLERVVVNLLRLCIRLIHREELGPSLFSALELMCRLSDDMLFQLADRIAAGLAVLVNMSSGSTRALPGWQVVLNLLSRFAHHPTAATAGFEALTDIVKDLPDFSIPLSICLQAILAFVRQSDAITDQTMAAVDLLSVVGDKIGFLKRVHKGVAPSSSPPPKDRDINAPLEQEEWMHLWLPVCQAISSLCRDVRREVRLDALGVLTKTLLVPSSVCIENPQAWRICFEQVLFPLISDKEFTSGMSGSALTLPSNQRNDDDIRIKAATVVCRVFLRQLSVLTNLPDFHHLWLKLLKILLEATPSRTQTSPTPPKESVTTLQESLYEHLKNLLLVASVDGCLDIASQRCGQDVWDMTWSVLTPVYPTLKYELSPASVQGPPGQEQPTISSSPKTPLPSEKPLPLSPEPLSIPAESQSDAHIVHGSACDHAHHHDVHKHTNGHAQEHEAAAAVGPLEEVVEFKASSPTSPRTEHHHGPNCQHSQNGTNAINSKETVEANGSSSVAQNNKSFVI